MININIEKARKIWIDKIRSDRKPYLEQLDVDFLIAFEQQDVIKQEEISNKKQLLRDATKDPRILGAEDVDTLKSIDPVKEIFFG